MVVVLLTIRTNVSLKLFSVLISIQAFWRMDSNSLLVEHIIVQ